MKNKQIHAVILGIIVAGFTIFIWSKIGRTATPIVIPTVIAYFVWLQTTYSKPADPKNVLIVYLLAVAIQMAHLLEEYLTEAYLELPLLFNGPPVEESLFVSIFIIIFSFLYVIAVIGMIKRNPYANYFIWFVTLGPMLANSIAHTYGIIATGSYFPGGYTIPFQFVVSIYLIRALIGKPMPEYLTISKDAF